MIDAKQIADTTIAQLGGGRFKMMTGAKHFTYDATGALTFQIPQTQKNRIRAVKITLDATDTYTMVFMRIRNREVTTFQDHAGLYDDQIAAVFTEVTGLHTKL